MSRVRRPLLLLALLLLPTCGASLDFVRPQRLAVAGEPAGGATVVSAGPALHITVRIAADATEFDPTTILRLMVNGIDRTADMSIGGDYATLTIDPPPVGAPQAVELFSRTGTVPLDTATYQALPFVGPTLGGVTPDTARVGTQVTISGTGFDAGPLRVFFGGVEGAVDAFTATSITATVPADAIPGLVFVVVGDDSAVGLVAFLPLDDTDTPVPPPSKTRLFYVAPAKGGIETVVTVIGINFTEDAVPRFNDRNSSRVYNVVTVNFPLLGDLTSAYAVVFPDTDPGAGTVQIDDNGDSNELPFTVQ